MDRLFTWVLAHKFVSAAIALAAVLLVAWLTGDGGSEVPLDITAATVTSVASPTTETPSPTPEAVTVPLVVGSSFKAATSELEDAGFDVSIAKHYSRQQAPGTVVAQSRRGGPRSTRRARSR